jgi:putative transcriptional regulator
MTAVALPPVKYRMPKPLTASSNSVALLVAMPGLEDAFFARSVVLLLNRGDHGAEGLVLNRPAPVLLTTVLEGAGVASPRQDTAGQQVHIGGPVEPHAGVLLVDVGSASAVQAQTAALLQEEAHEVLPGILMSASMDVLRAVSTDDNAGRFGLFLGRAGWTAGQLEQELAEGSWLLTEADPALLFAEGTDAVWRTALRLMGAEPETVVRELAEA